MNVSSRRITPVAALAVAVALACTVTASPASARRQAATASFCSVSKSVALQLVSTATALRNRPAAATVKKNLTTIRSSEPALRRTVPSRLKSNLTVVLRFVDLAYAKLSTVDWSIAALVQQPQTVTALETAANRAATSFAALKTYYRKVCKFRV